ncbi:4Fe-4S ferredoxin [candidate division GN15 bacterium]|nr:4Fe-4S ferredoxin [candidate division GN15 bacterium]
MPVRDIIRIDEDKCDGCGDCVSACAEGAIQLVDGKAKLVSEVYCDGLGACIGDCPQGAITIEKREAAPFNEAAVAQHLASQQVQPQPIKLNTMAGHGGCPGSAPRSFEAPPTPAARPTTQGGGGSQLRQWPVQLMLVPPHAPYLKDADILICADCVPFAVPDFHSRFLAGRALLVGCPKLDDLQYYLEKLKQIFAQATPRRITVLKMEVPCCSGIAQATKMARDEVAPDIPIDVHTVGVRGDIDMHHAPGPDQAKAM